MVWVAGRFTTETRAVNIRLDQYVCWTHFTHPAYRQTTIIRNPAQTVEMMLEHSMSLRIVVFRETALLEQFATVIPKSYFKPEGSEQCLFFTVEDRLRKFLSLWKVFGFLDLCLAQS